MGGFGASPPSCSSVGAAGRALGRVVPMCPPPQHRGKKFGSRPTEPPRSAGDTHGPFAHPRSPRLTSAPHYLLARPPPQARPWPPCPCGTGRLPAGLAQRHCGGDGWAGRPPRIKRPLMGTAVAAAAQRGLVPARCPTAARACPGLGLSLCPQASTQGCSEAPQNSGARRAAKGPGPPSPRRSPTAVVSPLPPRPGCFGLGQCLLPAL